MASPSEPSPEGKGAVHAANGVTGIMGDIGISP
eukprot:CAMPEP_0170445066 /NCGR_PEP_ID=MMETSP0117_2-20130122/48866_1 /TAXON_ID=400756 /ORGANISM="Durinskia baltica, Strain CSIRO CS-38" /LENGTH=32 /DNA_ID= /DNA_START= /DNA_END= /DNA_ORIENTATION=